MFAKLMSIAQQCINAVKGKPLIEKAVQVKDNKIEIMEKLTYNMKEYKFSIVGFGKAVLSMGLALEEIIGKQSFLNGVLIVPKGSKKLENLEKTKIEIYEGAENNIPDENAEEATKKLIHFIEQLKKLPKVVVFVLISGGGSSLLVSPKHPVNLQEKLKIIQQLGLSGVSINDLNTVRKRLSELKGGGLGQILYPLPTIGLILSDVINDPIDVIASGPLVENLDDSDAAFNILTKVLGNQIPNSVQLALNDPKNVPNLSHIDNFVIGSNEIALKSGAEFATTELKFQVEIRSRTIQGNVNNVGLQYAVLANNIAKQILEGEIVYKKPICILAGGETTVRVSGKGIGGRNQELALIFAARLDEIMTQQNNRLTGVNIYFLSCGTDGIDGPTDVAGAIVDKDFLLETKSYSDAVKYLNDNDSYNFFKNFNMGQNFVKFGHTGTNVMDLHVLLVIKNS